MMASPRQSSASSVADAPPAPTAHTRHVGYLLKLGETRKAWKRRWMTLDSGTGWLYWWTKPDGKVLGGIPLWASASCTVLPAPEASFRLAYTLSGTGEGPARSSGTHFSPLGGTVRFRDFRGARSSFFSPRGSPPPSLCSSSVESSAAAPTWVHHINDEIRAQTPGTRVSDVVLGLGQARSQAPSSEEPRTFSRIVGDASVQNAEPTNPELEAEGWL